VPDRSGAHREPGDLRIGFAGTPEFAATLLTALIEGGFIPELVLTQPDRPTGRGRKTRPSPVRRIADTAGIPVETPSSLKNESLTAYELDLLIVAAYGLILPPHILAVPRLGCLNVHASLLPRWRGAAPVERAIMAGDEETGVCLMQMNEGLDTGPVYRCQTVPIDPLETGGALEGRLAEAGGRLLLGLLPQIEDLNPSPQPEAGATYAKKLTAADSEPDLTAPAAQIARHIRALSDRQPVALFARDDTGPIRIRCLGAAQAGDYLDAAAVPGTIVRIDKAGLWLACSDGSVCIPKIQLNRGKGTAMGAKAAANGYPGVIHIGAQLAPTDPGNEGH
jgi:methionyl-tRNA formyltransferase